MKRNDCVVPRLIVLPAITRKLGRGSGLEGKITSSALDKFFVEVGRSTKWRSCVDNKKYEIGEGKGVKD
jgi:hypothetical protein